MSFEGFQLSQIEVAEGVSLRVAHGGSGPPLLLLHGYPQTHLTWGKIAGELAKRFTVVAPDLRGYGLSTKPASSDNHETSSKRAMARDAIALMIHFGFERFDVAGHDRGGRVGYRLALDHPDAVRRLTVLDIIPTGEVWARADHRFALGYWHWSFLAQPAPFPERLIAHDPEHFFFRDARPPFMTDEAYADYLASARRPEVIHAMCECYRAGAGFDRALDWNDMANSLNRIACPVQVLWGSRSPVGAWYEPIEIWSEWARDVRGAALDCGHYLPEEKPAETLAALTRFHGEGL